MMRKILKVLLWVVLSGVLLFALWFAWPRLPIITAFAAKGMCSSVFLADKVPERVEAEDLSFFPISLAKSRIDYEEKSVSSSVFGLAKRKAVYREGLGSVLVLGKAVEELKAASYTIPDPGYDPDTTAWPLGDVLPDQLPEGPDYHALDSVLKAAIDSDPGQALKKTLGVAVVYDNVLVGEQYLEGYDKHSRFHGWSMTKSITGAMAGALVMDGKLDIEAPVGLPSWEGDERAMITTKHVLHMSTGLDWLENYFTISEATVMLMQSDDMLASVAACELAHAPGSHWNYSSGDANLLSGILRDRIGDEEAYLGYAYSRLFHRIGMLNTVVETDASGLFVASSYSYGTVRDWARFGQLFLNNGIVEGDTVLAPEWVGFMRQAAPASDGCYGATFWLKEPSEANTLYDVPDDVFFADGFLGQRVYMIPSRKLVVVRMGYSLADFSLNDFLKGIIATLPE